ncbi:kinase subunit of RNA polymerase II carboxy-terminal domain kinase I [Dissophora globulifera]|uniref:Kinase subunit of RNA polymerase II carboxy-terminal domain kinase I n=1 Tax=Dissophora globulifera TaxID=979702 RepID=A0A9P6RND2_9FUNG|nr:kinase subunit of RNA polymerase II carboxy-terminal domain kinase I [Dissophora globulifera]
MNEDQPGSHGPAAPADDQLRNDESSQAEQSDSNHQDATTSHDALVTTTATSDTPSKAPITASSFTVPAVAKPLPTPALPFQSARASETLYTNSYSLNSSFGRPVARSSAAAAASAAALQLQRELDMQHEVLGRKPQLAQDIASKEPANPPTFRDYGATRDWRREQSRDRRDRSRERERERERDRYSRGRYDRSRERDRGRHRDRYSRERSYEREHDHDKDYRHEREYDRERDHRSERGYRDYRYHGEHSSDRDYRGYRHDRHDRHYRDSRDYERHSHRDHEYDEGGARSSLSGRYGSMDGERERGHWKEGDEGGETHSIKGQEPNIDRVAGAEGFDAYQSTHRLSGDYSASGYPMAPKATLDDDRRAMPGDDRLHSTPAHITVPGASIELREAGGTVTAAAPLISPTTLATQPAAPEASFEFIPTGPAAENAPPLSAAGVEEVMAKELSSRTALDPVSGYGHFPSDQAVARHLPPPPPPLQPVPPGLATLPQSGTTTAITYPTNGHPPPPPPHPPVAPPGYASQNTSVPTAAVPTEPAYVHSSGNAPPPPRRSIADDEYYGTHGHYYRHSRSSHYREGWHGADADHRYDNRRSHSRWPSHYPPEYDRHSRAPSPRNRDRYDYGYQEVDSQRPVAVDGYSSVGQYDPYAAHPETRRSPPPEPQGLGYVTPYPAVDPALQHISTQPATPAPKAEDLYERVGQVGEGTYGKVYKARNKQTGEFVALKRIRMEAEKDGFPITAMREIKLLQSLSDRHVVSLKELMVSKGAVYMVFEYMDYDLTGILAHPELKFRPEHIKCLMKQLLEGLGFLHHKGVLHRDIKGSNLLVNKLGELKLADFGLARMFQKKTKRDYTNRVITLWYRPPELILGATTYGPEVDMWSAGCIMVELFTRKPIFQGHNEITQLDQIWKVMGTPQKSTWPDVEQLPWYELIKHVSSESRASRFRELFGKIMSPPALDLAEALLSLNPKQRPTAVEALTKFAYFTEEEPAPCLPADLPKIAGDWHEYESKQRKKAIGKPKQQHPKHPSDGDRPEHPDIGKPQETATRPPTSKKHGLSGETKPSSGLVPVGLVVMSRSNGQESAVAPEDQKPDEIMVEPARTVEAIVPPPAVSPSYLPYAAASLSQPIPPARYDAPVVVAPMDPHAIPPPATGHAPPPQPVHPLYAKRAFPEHIVDHYAHDPGLIHEAPNGVSIHGRYAEHPGAYDPARAGAIVPPHGAAPLPAQPTDHYAAGPWGQQPVSVPEHPKGYHEGHEVAGAAPYDYYSRSRHYSYGRDQDRDRERDRDRYRDYGQRRGDYRSREWSRDRERDRGGRDRERDLGRERDYDRYRERRDYGRDRERGRERSLGEDDYYYRDRGRERDAERDSGEYRGRERERRHDRDVDGDRERERERDRDRDRDRERERERDRDYLEYDREHKERERDRDYDTGGVERDRDIDRVRNGDREQPMDLDRLESEPPHGRRRGRSEDAYDDEYDRSRATEREEGDKGRPEYPALPKKMKLSTDSSSLSPPSTTSTFSPMT